MQNSATSRGGVPVRLTDERWAHIVEEHCELAGMREHVLEAVSNAEEIFAGARGELLALRPVAHGKTLVVVYRETGPEDAFVITAFLTSRPGVIRRRTKTWPPRTSKSI